MSCFAVLILIAICAESIIFTEFVHIPMLGDWCLYFIIIFAVIQVVNNRKQQQLQRKRKSRR